MSKPGLLDKTDIKSFDLKIETPKGEVQLSGLVNNPCSPSEDEVGLEFPIVNNVAPLHNGEQILARSCHTKTAMSTVSFGIRWFWLVL